eukprot:122099_1
MGICGASGICRSKDNAPPNNMHDKQPQGTPPDIPVASSPSCTPSSNDNPIHKTPPIKTHPNSTSNSNSMCQSLPTMSKSRVSAPTATTSGTSCDSSPENPQQTLTKSRKSSNNVSLVENAAHDNKFVRKRATSQEGRNMVEYAMIDDSDTTKVTEYDAGCVTPLATPSTHQKNHPNHHFSSPPSSHAPLAEMDDTSIMNHTQNAAKGTKYLNASDDNININNIYVGTRELNLSFSNAGPSLLVPPLSTVPRYNSTSEEFANLMMVDSQFDVMRRNSKSMTDEFMRDGSELFQWRLSHGSMGNIALNNKQDKVKSLESASHDQSLTDL